MSRTKKLLSLVLAVLLAAIVTLLPTAQVVARAQAAEPSAADTGPGKYISEVRVGLGKSKSDAAKSLAGYTILTNNKGEYADLNEDAESDSWIGSKGSKVVLLGYKTTNDPADAITDLAVMNMDGGYSVEDYEMLMDKYLVTQIKPMITGFIAAIQEYRENYASSNPANKKRAQFAHDMLNLLYDDDTGAYMGDLLLNETKWEMGDEAYDKLSDAERKNHADLVTIFMQSNGQATLSIQNLLARASDTSDTTWIERFIEADAEALMDEFFPTMLPTDAEAMMDNVFGNDARKILSMWDGLHGELEKYDEAIEFVENFDMNAINEAAQVIDENSGENTTVKKELKAAAAALELEAQTNELNYYLSLTAMHDYLESTPYFDEFTLLDFFSQSKADAESDMMTLYGLVSSLSPGQRAGLDYMTMRELILMAMTDADEYSAEGYTGGAVASIYEGVDRQIYEKGAVALTSDALRKKAAITGVDDYPLSTLTTVMWGVTAATMFAAIGSWVKFGVDNSRLNSVVDKFKAIEKNVPPRIKKQVWYTPEDDPLHYLDKDQLVDKYVEDVIPSDDFDDFIGEVGEVDLNETIELGDIENVIDARKTLAEGEEIASKTSFSRSLAIGLTVAVVILTAISVYMTYRDLCDYYDVVFSPIPNYMVDEADITRKNENNEVYVIKNQTAYYKAVLCNRTEKDEKYKEIGDKADLNGDVGRMWVALYSVKNDAQYPILADSFKVVTGTSNVPLGYDNAIHNFGSGAAFDMNNTYYTWNHGKGGIYVYYKVDNTVAPRANAVTGTVQTAGMLAGVGGAGLLVGMLAGSLLISKRKKKSAVGD